MNAKPNRRTLLSATAAALLAIGTTIPAYAAVDCTAPKGVAEQRACSAAADGVEALRRFSERTRVIYHVYMQDYGHAVGPTATAKGVEKTNVASVK